MQPTHITDDIERLLELLPQEVQTCLSSKDSRADLLEVILDLGRPPEARYPSKVITLGEKFISRKDLINTVNKLGKFGSDNRAGIERTLHRISAIRNRQQDVVGLTCRVGRAIFGTVNMIRDLIEGGQSLLLMGRPGVGKTTALREIARVIADELERRVVIIDTSNEIAGDGDIPHPAIGKARRMQVARPEYQHQVMIEAVENHMPEVIVIDEIGTELETQAARTIAERGVQLIATAHGNSIANLIKNPTLSDLVGGIQSVTLGDEEARRRRTQKTVLERAADPTFEIAVEINHRNNWSIHNDVASTVDLLLRGQTPRAQTREIGTDGIMKLVESKESKYQPKRPTLNKNAYQKNNLTDKNNSLSNYNINNESHINKTKGIKPLQILCCGVSQQLLNEAIRRHNWSVRLVDHTNEADVLLSVRNALGKNQLLRKEAQDSNLPIHVIKSDNLHQIERAIQRLLNHHQSCDQINTIKPDLIEKDNSFSALEECRLALEKIVIPMGRPVELLPRSERVIQMQAELVTRYSLRSNIFGQGEQQRLRVYPP